MEQHVLQTFRSSFNTIWSLIMKLFVIGGSNSKNSINRQLALHAASLFSNAEISNYDISKIDLPLFSVDLEAEIGSHPVCVDFARQMDACDLIVISLAENNGSFNVGLKNLLDWTSRIKDRKTFGGKDMLLMATSPGARGGQTVLESAQLLFPRFGANILASFSFPSFHENFDAEKGIKNDDLKQQLQEIISKIEA